MINKFRYRKPSQAPAEAGVENGTLTRNKDAKKCKMTADGVAVVFSDVLDNETKRKLKELFSELQHSPAKALPPDSLRKALADSFLDQQRFQIGFMDDAAECFEKMLLRIHDHIAHREPEDACSAPHCISHQKFAMTLVEQSVCENCGATSEPMSFTQMVQYVSTSTLVHQLRMSVNYTGRPDTFGRLLQKAGNMGEARPCPASCGSVTQMRRVLMNHPEIVSIGLVWNSEKPSAEHIAEVFSCIETTLKLNQVFSTVTDTSWADTTTHNLVGVVTYYGKHYSTFFFHTKLMEWIFLDDATVRDVGPRWEQVVEKCRKGKFQPLLLLYASPDGTPVNLDYAPKLNTPFYVDKTKPQLNQQLMRRSVTPSPEKPNVVGTATRRAITPNPENSQSLNQKPPLPKAYNEYQNLAVIQKNIVKTGCDQVDGCVGRPHVNVHRTLSNGSSSGVESGVCVPDHLNIPRRRDSGNWSGDRNSASSASSTTMENPYLYLVGKVPPGSPTRNNGNNGAYDAGYDSYSLSSNDSTNMTTLQHMMKTGHLAQIPEDYSNANVHPASQSCDILCDEADELLVKSRQLEDAHDLVLALALCNAAATKARAAMNAPYNNPQTLTLARMKHNTCVMRARSLHRRMTQNQAQNKENAPEIRHTREGSSGSGRHSRQNSRDKGNHSRQNSRELLQQQEKEKAKPTKSIEIYATLPKKKDALKAIRINDNDDDEYVLYDNNTKQSTEREFRSIFSRSKSKEPKVKEKRSRSEDRNKIGRGDFSIAPEVKDTLKKAKEKEDKKENKEGKNKKQHKIRRKLLMGGLIRRKNRSMPDLTDSTAEEHRDSSPCGTTVDDANVGLKATSEALSPGMSGYLSEGHLEFSGTTTNPNLERSKLMRKSFHCSAGKILTAAKVPPPPPLRTTSQLSRSKSNVPEVAEKFNIYHNLAPFNQSQEEQSSMSLPYYGNANSSYENDSSDVSPSSYTVVTQADVHQEQSPDSGVDEVDCMPCHSAPMLDLPPYPSPAGSAIHSRQASEEFPPPPPPLDLSALDELLPQAQAGPDSNSLLAQLQNKRHQILAREGEPKAPVNNSTSRSSGDTWLKELQAKQAALKMKKNEGNGGGAEGLDEVNTQRYAPGEIKVKSVKDLASKFENGSDVKQAKSREPEISSEQIAEEIREVEMITSAVNKVFANNCSEDGQQRYKPQKKKSVSFCDQVILVATAEEQEEETYIPNPILERVLRSAANNPDTMAVRQELTVLRNQQPLPPNLQQQQQRQQAQTENNPPATTPPPLLHHHQHQQQQQQQQQLQPEQQPLYGRRNSVDSILSDLPRVRADEQYYTYQENPYAARSPQEPNNLPQYPPVYGYHQSVPDPRQSPYQPLPPNSSAYYRSTQVPNNGYGYSPPSSRPCYNTNGGYPPNIRQSTPSPMMMMMNYPPSPVPSVSSCNNYQQPVYRGNNVYQRVPMPNDYAAQHQYQRVPPPHGEEPILQKYGPYQPVMPSAKPHAVVKKSVSFEPGTKCCESPTPTPVVTPIVVNNSHNSIPTDKTKCSLCRKKNVVATNLYCKDCEFYMSRFKPKA